MTVKKKLTTNNAKDVWEDALQELKARDRTLFVLLTSSGGIDLFVLNSALHIAAKNKWQITRMTQPNNIQLLDSVLNRFLDMNKPIQFTTISEFPGSIVALQMEEYAGLTNINWRSKNENDLKEELDSSKKILRAKRRIYNINQEKQALLGTGTPASIIVEIEDAEKDMRRYDINISDIKQKLLSPRKELLIKVKSAIRNYSLEIDDINKRLFEVLAKLELAKKLTKVDISSKKFVTSVIDNLRKLLDEDKIASRRQALLVAKIELETVIENIDELDLDIKDTFKSVPLKLTLDRFELAVEEKYIRTSIVTAEELQVRVIEVMKVLEKEIEELESY